MNILNCINHDIYRRLYFMHHKLILNHYEFLTHLLSKLSKIVYLYINNSKIYVLYSNVFI